MIKAIRLGAAIHRYRFDREMCGRSKAFVGKLRREKANKKRIVSEHAVVKNWCLASRFRRTQVMAIRKNAWSGAAMAKKSAIYYENMARITSLAAWGKQAQRHIPKNHKGVIRYKTWYRRVMRLAVTLQKTPCPIMATPAGTVHKRHSKSLTMRGNTMILTHTNYFYTKPCHKKCRVIKRSVQIKKKV